MPSVHAVQTRNQTTSISSIGKLRVRINWTLQKYLLMIRQARYDEIASIRTELFYFKSVFTK